MSTSEKDDDVVVMTADAAREIAERGGYVFWPRSGIVEQLHINKKRILARPLGQPREHLLGKKKIYYCREVMGEEKDRLKEEMLVRRKKDM